MSIKLRDLQQWRDFFSKFDFSIFDIIQYAIVVARIDEPEEFRINRDKIVESLFSYRLMKCSGCNHVELAVAQDEDDSCKEGSECDVGFNKDGKNNSKVNSRTDDNLREMNIESNYSYDEAEALTEEIEEESQIVGEVLRIKEILVNHHEQSAEVLLDSLRRLQLMKLSVETLKATGIGKAVNRLCKHVSKKICHLARALIAEWKSVVDAWVEAASDAAVNAVTEGSPDSVKSCTVNVEEGLPSPPLDEGAFLATQTTSIELSQFFDGMDDEGNPRVVCESKRSQGNRRRPPVSPHLPDQTKDQTKRPECIDKETKPLRANAGSIKPSKPALHHTSNGQEKIERRCHGNESKRKLHVNPQNHSDELSVRVKLEETKKRLQEGYQQAENAKRQRTIQVMELHDLPKQGNHSKNFHQKPGSHIRNRMNGRR